MTATIFQDIRARRTAPPALTQPSALASVPAGQVLRSELAALIPALRAFARSLCQSRDLADELVKETLLKAWTARHGSDASRSLKSQTFAIMHTVFHATPGTYPPAVGADAPLENPITNLELSNMALALARLPINQREALILITAAGFTYKAAALITGAATGTMKSRVARARQALNGQMGMAS